MHTLLLLAFPSFCHVLVQLLRECKYKSFVYTICSLNFSFQILFSYPLNVLHSTKVESQQFPCSKNLVFLSIGVAVGAGWQAIVAYINIGCYYVVGLPLGIVLGFVVDFGAVVSYSVDKWLFFALLILTRQLRTIPKAKPSSVEVPCFVIQNQKHQPDVLLSYHMIFCSKNSTRTVQSFKQSMHIVRDPFYALLIFLNCAGNMGRDDWRNCDADSYLNIYRVNQKLEQRSK